MIQSHVRHGYQELEDLPIGQGEVPQSPFLSRILGLYPLCLCVANQPLQRRV
jgi:hypothetical protein